MRNPYVAGQFYNERPEEVKEQIEQCFLSELGPGRLPDYGGAPRDIVGCVSPHAGYMYSGPVAAYVYAELSKQTPPKTVVVVSPNHTGHGSSVALSGEDWETPLGVVETDMKLVKELSDSCGLMNVDESAHRYEHSLEVQLPFLQYIYQNFKMVPICMKGLRPEVIGEISDCLSKIDDVLIVASSDFTHYEPQEAATEKDNNAIVPIIDMEEEKFLQKVYEHKLSICGYGPIALCIATAKKMGAKKAELLKYSTSGEITGDMRSVVGYAGIVMRR